MAAVTAVLRWVQIVAFALVGAWAVRLWWRDRRPTHAWLATTFGGLGLVVVSSPVLDLADGQLPAWGAGVVDLVLVAVLAAFPYALLRLLDTFDPVAPAVRRVVGLVCAALVIATALVPLPETGQPWTLAGTVFAVAVVATWLVVLPYVALRFWRAGGDRPAVARRRLRLLAAAVAVLSVALLVVATLQSPPGSGGQLVEQLVALTAAILLLLGAVPPPWLRAAWRQPEEAALHRAALGLMAATDPDRVADVLIPHLRAVAAARGVAVVHRSRVLAVDGLADVQVALRIASAGPGAVAPAEVVDWQAGQVELLRQPLTDGAVVVWIDATTPFLGDEERRLLTRTALLADLALQRAELLASERAAREQLAEANAELESFVYSASHDLKSPLIAMLGYVDVLAEEQAEAMDDDARWYLERLRSNGRYMESLIRDLLELSRIGRVQTVREEVDLGALLDGLHPELVTQHPDLTVAHGPLPTLWANGTRLRQLFVNLLDNAARHGRHGEARVEIEARHHDDGAVEVLVRDDGPGIPAAYREQVFGVFERLDGDETSGTGIGLAICRKVVETLGGRIWVGEGEGATFHLRFPADAVVHAPQDRATPALAAGTVPAATPRDDGHPASTPTVPTGRT